LRFFSYIPKRIAFGHSEMTSPASSGAYCGSLQNFEFSVWNLFRVILRVPRILGVVPRFRQKFWTLDFVAA